MGGGRKKRSQGNRDAAVKKQRLMSFSFSKHLPNEPKSGQSFEEWVSLDLVNELYSRFKEIGNFTVVEAIGRKLMAEYQSFPNDSKLSEPKHIVAKKWYRINLFKKKDRIERIIGVIEDDVFYVVFLDKDHHFYPYDFQSKNKTKR